MRDDRTKSTAKDDDGPASVLGFARIMHDRLRELEAGGRDVAVTPEIEALLAVDPTYTPRDGSVQPNTNPRMNDVERAARILRTTVSALMGEKPHMAVYAGPPSNAEEERRRVHREAGGEPTPFTVLLFPPVGDTKAQALIAEFPIVDAFGDTEEEALESLREALDALLTRTYEKSTSMIVTHGRTYKRQPFNFQPPAAGRVR
jgi:predicted RNase H-like HicB family nuclease